MENTEGKSKNKIAIIGGLVFFILALVAGGYFYLGSDTIPENVKTPVVKDETVKEGSKIEEANETKQEENMEQTNENEDNGNAEEVDTNETTLEEEIETHTDGQELTEEEENLTKLLGDLDASKSKTMKSTKVEEEDPKEGKLIDDETPNITSKIEHDAVVDNTKIEMRDGKIVMDPNDYLVLSGGVVELTDDYINRMGIERNSIIEKIIMDALGEDGTKYVGVDIQSGKYTIVLDDNYNIVKFKKDGVEIEGSPVIGMPVFEIDNLYKATESDDVARINNVIAHTRAS